MSALAQKARARPLTRAEFERFSPMVRRQAMWLARRGPRQVTVADLVAAGWAGLIDAVSAELDDDAARVAYVEQRVRGAMLEHLESLDPHLAETRGLSRSIARAIASLHATLDVAPDEEQIAAALSMSLGEYHASLLCVWGAGLARIELIDLDRPLHSTSDMHEDSLETDPVAAIAHAIDRLPQRSRELFMLLYQEGCSLEEAADVLGKSVRAVEIVASEAMHRVRALVGRE